MVRMSVADVRAYLEPWGLAGAVVEFTGSSHTVGEAAEQVGTLPEHIAKTLAFYDPANPEAAILIVAAGDVKVQGGAFKRRFGGKGNMVAPDRLVALTGHPMGGVCPFRNPATAQVWLDESLRRFETVWPAAGSADSAVEVATDRLEAVADAAGWVDICTGWRAAENENDTAQESELSL